MPIEEIACPQCGGSFRPEEEGAFASCPFCGSRLHLGEDRAIGHEILLPTLRAEETPERLGRWLKEREVTASPSDVKDQILWFPFWLLPDGRLLPAAPLLSSNVTSFHLPPGDRKAFRAELARPGDVVPASILPEGLPVSEAERKAARLLHLPFREIRFRLFRRDHRLWLDAVSGQALAFELPPTSERRLDVTYAVLLALLFVVVLWGVRAVFGVTIARHLPGLGALVAAGPLFWLVTKLAMRLSEAE